MSFAQTFKRNCARVLGLSLLLLLLFALPAFAEEPIGFTLSVEPASLTAPGPVTVSIRVVNEGDADMTEPVLLYDPDGQIVTNFGDGGQALIKQGEFVAAQHTYNVTQAQLNEGRITYMLSYNQTDENGNVVVRSLSKSAELSYTGTNVDLSVTRTIDPEVVRSGNSVTVRYELYNAGNVPLSNLRVRENSSLSGAAQTVAALAPGERTTVQFTAAMNKSDLTSEGHVTYRAGDESLSVDLPAVAIPLAKPGLNLDKILTADRTSIETGDTVTLTLSIRNDGNITYSNITVTDPKYGEIFTNLTLGPGETLVRDKQFTLSETTTFAFAISLPDNTGTVNTVTSNELKISVYDPAQVMHLNVVASVSSTTVPRIPADVDFTLTVTNNSSQEAKNIHLSHGSVRFYTIESLAPSQTVTVTRSFQISQAGRFRFTASVNDALDNTVTFDSNEITIAYSAPTSAPTMVPVPTVPPLVTLTAAPIEQLEPVALRLSGALRIAAFVLLGLFAACFILFVVSTVIRMQRRRAAKNAFDHMEVVARRDYNEPAKPDESAVEAPVGDETPLAEKPSDEILREPDAPAAPETSGSAAAGNDDSAYRLTRRSDAVEEAELPPEAPDMPADAAQPALDAAPTDEKAPVRHRRSRRQHDAPNEDE